MFNKIVYQMIFFNKFLYPVFKMIEKPTVTNTRKQYVQWNKGRDTEIIITSVQLLTLPKLCEDS